MCRANAYPFLQVTSTMNQVRRDDHVGQGLALGMEDTRSTAI